MFMTIIDNMFGTLLAFVLASPLLMRAIGIDWKDIWEWIDYNLL